MHRLIRTFVLSIAALTLGVFHTEEAFAGAWAQPHKGSYVKIGVGATHASEQYKESGETFQLLSDDVLGTFSSVAALLYGEYGLLPRFTLFGSTMFNSLTLDNDLQRANTRGLGDVHLGFRYQFLDSPTVLSLQMATKIPTGYTPDPDTMVPSLGNGVYEIDARLLAGRSFYPFPVYVSAELGYRLRGRRPTSNGEFVSYADEIPYFLEVGYGPTENVWLRGVVSGVRGLGRPQDLDIFSLTPLTQSYTKVGPSVIATVFDRYQLSLDYLYTVSGVNTVRSHDFILGLAFTFGQ